MRNKRGIVIGAIIVFFLAVLVIVIGIIGAGRQFSRDYGYQKMMGIRNIAYPVPAPIDNKNQFLPLDALKSGEIAIIVDNLENAKKSVANIAEKNDGVIYSSYIEYASNNVKNGSIVVQVPQDRFDTAFENLKKVGSEVIQESTQQIEKRIYYPMMEASGPDAPQAAEAIDSQEAEGASKTTEDAPLSAPEAQGDAPSSISIYPQGNFQAQDKAYIRVIFADYGSKKTGFGLMMGKNNPMMAGGIINQTYAGQNMINNLWVVLGIKALLLAVLVGLLVFILKKIFGHYHAHRKARRQARQEVRQLSKTRKRVVRSARRK